MPHNENYLLEKKKKKICFIRTHITELWHTDLMTYVLGLHVKVNQISTTDVLHIKLTGTVKFGLCHTVNTWCTPKQEIYNQPYVFSFSHYLYKKHLHFM